MLKLTTTRKTTNARKITSYLIAVPACRVLKPTPTTQADATARTAHGHARGPGSPGGWYKPELHHTECNVRKCHFYGHFYVITMVMCDFANLMKNLCPNTIVSHYKNPMLFALMCYYVFRFFPKIRKSKNLVFIYLFTQATVDQFKFWDIKTNLEKCGVFPAKMRLWLHSVRSD